MGLTLRLPHALQYTLTCEFTPPLLRSLRLPVGAMMDMDGDSSFGVSDDVRSSLFAAIESAGEAVIITDLTSRITYVNPAFEHITQYSRREALGQTPRLLKSERNDPAVYQDLWRTITRGGVWRGSFLNCRFAVNGIQKARRSLGVLRRLDMWSLRDP